jgi:predicted alpha/beta superfamily hydrolase
VMRAATAQTDSQWRIMFGPNFHGIHSIHCWKNSRPIFGAAFSFISPLISQK